MDERLNATSIESQAETQRNKYITFTIDREDYGIPIYYIKDIVSKLPITQVPSVPDYVKGITNLRGDIIPVVDVRIRFRKTEKEYNDRTCIVVIEYQDLLIGFIVDRVKEVLEINEEDILVPPDAKKGFHNRYVKSIGKTNDKVTLIIDLERLIKEDYEI